MQSFKGSVEQVGLLLQKLQWSLLIRSRLENWSVFLSSNLLIAIALVLVVKMVTLLTHLNTQKLPLSCLMPIIPSKGPLNRFLMEMKRFEEPQGQQQMINWNIEANYDQGSRRGVSYHSHCSFPLSFSLFLMRHTFHFLISPFLSHCS